MILTFDSTELEISAKGGTVTRWQHGETHVLYPQQRLYVDGNLKRRGGIPVCAPIHGTPPDKWIEQGLKQHGFVRDVPGEFYREGGADLHQAMEGYRIWNVQQVNRPDFPWHLLCSMGLWIHEKGFAHQLILSQKLDSSSERPMPVAPGIHPYFATPNGMGSLTHGGQRLLIGDLELGKSQTWRLVPEEPVRLRMGLGTVVIQPNTPYEELVIWTDSRRYICVEPVTKRGVFGSPEGINLKAGESLDLKCTFTFEPYEEEFGSQPEFCL